jgi:hypothetical protein
MARLEITDGPSKFDLMIALFDGKSHDRRTVKFVFHNPPADFSTWHNFVVNMLERKNGQLDDWLFAGYFSDALRPTYMQGFFSTKTRKGWMEPYRSE